MYEDILLQVKRPAQYIGQEWNVSRKDFDQAGIKFALCFPDLYEVGMSNLGIRIIYGLLNNINDLVCERFFSPDLDLDKILRTGSRQILSLESDKKLSEFDIIGFSLGTELCYTNVLNILELGAIPLKSKFRDHNYPLVIGGGSSVLNPEPVSDFFDLFVIGEAEELIVELLDIYRENQEVYKKGSLSKEELLFKLSQVQGVYVPTQETPLKVNKRFVKDLDASFFPAKWIVPYIQVIHDRISLEIMRGCPNRCRFCQARAQYWPFRYRSIENILKLAKETYLNSGYEEISLCGLSASDYPNVEELLKELMQVFDNDKISIALPSIKPKDIVGQLSSIISKVKKTGLTFAPEAGSKKMRDALGKNFDEEIFFKSLAEAYKSGYQHVKLYFMIGLPGEENEDLDAIIDFSTKVSQLKRDISGSPAQVNISINTLIPKPHTYFERLKMANIEEIKQKQDYLRSKIKNKRLSFSFHSRYMSFLEGVFSRGDRKLNDVILAAFKMEAKFDAWSNYFSFEKWMAAFKECGIDPKSYLDEKNKDEILPWSRIDAGIGN